MTPTNSLHCSLPYTVYKFLPEVGEFSACCDAAAFTFDAGLFSKLGSNYFSHHPKLIQRKIDLNNGVRSVDCVNCWKKEDNGIRSMRNILGDSEISFNPEQINPRRIELWMSSMCNLGCFMCNLGNSSTLRKIWKSDRSTSNHDGIGYDIWVNNLDYTKTSNIDNFKQKLLNFTVSAIQNTNENFLCIAYLGGEPTLHDEMYDHADIFIEAGKDIIKTKTLMIELTTNATSKDKLSERFYNMFKKYKNAGWNTRIKLSFDAVGKEAQVRHGVDEDQVKRNFENWILPESCVDMLIVFNVVSGLNIVTIDKYVKYLHETAQKFDLSTKSLSIHFNYLLDPKWMDVNNIPKKYYIHQLQSAIEMLRLLKANYKNIKIHDEVLIDIFNKPEITISQQENKNFFNTLDYVNTVYKKSYPDWDFYTHFEFLSTYKKDCGLL